MVLRRRCSVLRRLQGQHYVGVIDAFSTITFRPSQPVNQAWQSVVLGRSLSHLGGLLQVDDDLAEHVARLDRSQGLRRFVEGVGLEHLGIDLAVSD